MRIKETPKGAPVPSTNGCRVPIASDADIVLARQQGRSLAEQLGFDGTERTLIATAISELARNIVQYAAPGEIVLTRNENGGRTGLTVVAKDSGPGIANVKQALTVGYSTSGGLGLGLPGVGRIMDSLEIDSAPHGTTVRVTKWVR